MGVGELQEQNRVADGLSGLLELAAADDLIGFKTAVEEGGLDVDGFGLWYGRRVGLKKIGLEERTPLMIASMFGSTLVLMYILETGCVDINRACGSDGATALHCAVFGASAAVVEVIKLLVNASADVNCVDVEGNRPSDLIISFVSPSYHSIRKTLELMLNGCANSGEACILGDKISEKMEDQFVEEVSSLQDPKDGTERKDYPVDLSLPDIKNGIYGSDEFRMYSFKIKSCSRAYSHDWTECPFAHPGENARRRDPRKFHYSCVPCPEFRKGACRQGDACEYAHGIFECWLHPAQYRTRLCKDEIGCNRKVCFFAHKPEELRPLYASSGSAVPSSLDFLTMSPHALSSPSLMMSPSSTPSGPSSPMAGSMWSNQSNFAPPTLNLSGSRLRTTLSGRDMDLEVEFLGRENHRRRQQQLLDELSGLSSPTAWNNSFSSSAAFASSQGDWYGEPNRFSGLKPTNLDDVFGSHDLTILSHLQGLSLGAGTTQLQSPTGTPMRHNMNQQLRSSYPSNLSSSPARTSQSFGIDQAAAAASFAMTRSSAFAKRSQSFIDRSAVTHHSGISSTAAAAAASSVSDWGSPNGKLEWGIQKEELNKLRKSASFGLRSSGSSYGAPAALVPSANKEHDSWPMIKDIPLEQPGRHNIEEHNVNNGGSEMLPQWVEQFYMDQEQLAA